MVALWTPGCKESFRVVCCPCQPIHRQVSTALTFNRFFCTSVKCQFLVTLSSGPTLSLLARCWWKAVWFGYFGAFPPPPSFLSALSLFLSTGSSCFSCTSLAPSPYPPAHIHTEDLRQFSRRVLMNVFTCDNACYSLKNFGFQSKLVTYFAGLPCSVILQIKLGFTSKLHLQILKSPQPNTAVWIPVNTNFIDENGRIVTDTIKNVY